MTDPRIAALAEALRSESVRKYVMEAWVEEGVSEPGYATPEEMAAAILAALDGWVLVRTDDLWSACDCPYHGQEDAYRKVLANHQPYCNLAQEPLHSIMVGLPK